MGEGGRDIFNQGDIYTGIVEKIDLGSKIFLRKTRPLLILKSTPIFFSKLLAEVGVFKHNVSKLGGAMLTLFVGLGGGSGI